MTANSKTAAEKPERKFELFAKYARRFAPTSFLGIVWIAALLGKHSSVDFLIVNRIVILCAMISTFLVVAQRLPLQNIFGIIATMFSGGAFLILVDRLLQFPSPQFFGIESSSTLFFLLIWTTTLVNVRGTLKFFLRRWIRSKNHGLWLIALSSFALAILDTASRGNPGQFFRTVLFAGMTLIASVPWFIEKKQSNVEPDFQPVLLLGILLLQRFCGAN